MLKFHRGKCDSPIEDTTLLCASTDHIQILARNCLKYNKLSRKILHLIWGVNMQLHFPVWSSGNLLHLTGINRLDLVICLTDQ